MTLRKRILTSIGLTIVVLIVLLFLFAQFIVLGSFIRLEEQRTRQSAERISSALQVDLNALAVLNRDWAAWDDTYAFMLERDPIYIESNLVDSTFTGAELNFIIFIDTEGELVYGKGYDYIAEEPLPIPESLLAHLTEAGVLLMHTDAANAQQGILLLPEGPLLVSTKPILTSENEGPARGTLLIARYLDELQIESLIEVTLMPFSVLRFEALASEFQLMMRDAEDGIVVQAVDSATIVSYVLVNDIYNQPALVLEIELFRDIYAQGRRSVSYLLATLLGVGGIFGALMLWVVERAVLRRLADLNAAVVQISASGDLSQRVPDAGEDELASLARVVNEMLVTIERAQQERDHAARGLERYTQALSHLNWLGQKLTATLNQSQIAAQLSQVATKIIGAQSVSVWVLDEETEELFCWASSDYVPNDPDISLVDWRLAPGQGVAGWVLQHGESVLLNDVAQDARFFSGVDAHFGYVSHSMLAVPLRGRGDIIGVLELVNKLSGDFLASDLNLAETLAAFVEVAIENARLVEQLRQYAKELETHNDELDAFAHTVAHDLKNPLAVLAGFAGLLRSRFTRMSDEEIAQTIDRIERNAYKMSNIIDELLILASVRKVEEVAIVPLDMATIAEEAVTRLAEMIADEDAEVVLAETWPAALGYGPWIEEVWVNYLSNALKYGGDSPQVTLGATESANGHVRFWVRDNGPGLTPSAQSKLFALFERLDQTRARGHGLGLSIVRRIVEKLGGEVGVESEVGKGSLFWFSLPRGEAPQD